MTSSLKSIPSSFRDPSGFLFTQNNRFYRQVNTVYRPHYEALMSSGLYETLVSQGLLVSHQEAERGLALTDKAYCVIEPEKIPFISYPYEWSFGQLKDAALATLKILRIAFEHGMVLKDASGFNIQFHRGKPILIDTLSFELYTAGRPWAAYRQFCQHFLAPLAMMSRCDIRLRRLLRTNIDGIPLDLASRLLPVRSWVSPTLLMHIHLHAKSQQRYADSALNPKQQRPISRFAFLGLIDSLKTAVRKLDWRPAGTVWGDYYNETNYSDAAMEAKKKIVAGFLARIRPQTTWDLGANTGVFSRLAAEAGSRVVALDIDAAAVEQNYRWVKQTHAENILPLLLDICNPSPALGWAHEERMSLRQRGPADAILALALIHHLALSNNLPLPRIAQFLASLSPWLIVEFIPKEDSQARRLLSARYDIFPNYTQEQFEKAFCRRYQILERIPVADTLRTLYLMKRNDGSEA